MTTDGDELSSHFGYRQVSPEEKGKLVREHFDRISPYYDVMNTVLSFGLHHAWKREAVSRLALRPGARVLDLCGGTGDLSLLAAGAVGNRGTVVLCDINRPMMKAGLPKLARSPQGPRVVLTQGDAESLPFPSDSFDAAMVGFGIRNVTRWRRGFEELHRVLKPDGRLLCLEFAEPPARWFRALYDFYSFQVMPRVGRWLVGNSDGYAYLSESIRLFPDPSSLVRILEDLGFADVEVRSFCGGIAVSHIGRKARR